MASSSFGLWQSLAAVNAEAAQDVLPISQIGGKAFNLIRNRRAGHVIPDGFVLTVAYFQPWIEQLKIMDLFQNPVSRSREDCEALQAKCHSLTLTKEQQQTLDDAVATVFDSNKTVLVAVRSSSPHEDSTRTSFAGIYHSTLGVPLEPRSDLLRAIKESFASSFNYSAVCVSGNKVSGVDLVIAVIIQKQIDAVVSGVAFSLDPISNCYDDAVISANFGLGETVVAGLVIPDTYTVDKVKQTILARNVSKEKTTVHVLDKQSGVGVSNEPPLDPSKQALSDEQILQVASLVIAVEKTMEIPVDIEWAFDENERLHLVQARPITTYLKLFPEMITRPGDIKRLYMDAIVASQGFSDSLSVMGMDLWARMVTDVFPHYKHGEDGTIWELHGREYIVLSNLLAMTGGTSVVQTAVAAQGEHAKRALDTINLKEYKPLQVTKKNKYFFWKALKFGIGLVPSFLRGIWNWETAMTSYTELSEEVFKRFCFGGVEDNCDDDTSLGESVDKAMASFHRLIPLHMAITATFYYKWKLDRLFAGDEDALDLLVALDMNLDGNPTSEMGHAMLKIASFPEIQAITSSEVFMERWDNGELPSEVTATIQDYISRFGCRGMREIDVAIPRSYEDLADLFNRIKQIDIADNQILTVDKRKKEVMEKLGTKAQALRREKQFQRYANVIQKMGGYREHPKYVFVFLLAHIRRRALRFADKLVREGRLPDVSSIFDLTVEQLDKAIVDPVIDIPALIACNKAPYGDAAVKEWPLLVDSRGKILRAQREYVEGGLGGDPISPGISSGKARVLSSPYEQPLLRGEILVTRAAEPSWTPIFLNASAVVLEVGGPTQHGAIIAREYGIPCVSGVEDATKLIKDGQMIEVDGARGIIMFL